ncbi:hypothetical protein L3X38_040392 [Prunus dulcis]|uniref:RNase H type-1 domain-containing protein n=1 Tax=Prunus dulcis TaxID=3755 RepID=A0AAD4V8W5_PRUDU|nr:hypothetical protein L3X38_040392 [Prunus dulcis]
MTQRSSLNLNLAVSEFLTDQQWDISKLRDIVDQDIIDKISAIPLPLCPLDDQLIWGPNPSGIFSIKSAYHVQMHDTYHHTQAALLKKMWGLKVPPKVKNFLLVTHKKKTSSPRPFAPLPSPGSILGVLFVIFTGKPFLTYFPLATLLKLFGAAPAWLLRSLLQILISSPGWIWEARNHLIFKGINPHPVRVLTVAGQIGLDYWQQNSSGFVICDSDGHILLAGAKNIGKNTIFVAECTTLWDGLVYAAHRGWRKILAEGDSKLIIDCVNKKAMAPWSINLLIKDITLLSSFFDSCSFSHVFREANFTGYFINDNI